MDGSTLLALTQQDIREELGITRLSTRKLLWDELEKLRATTEIQNLNVAVDIQIREVEVLAQESNKAVWEEFKKELMGIKSTINDSFAAAMIGLFTNTYFNSHIIRSTI